MTLSYAAQEGIALKRLCAEINLNVSEKPVVIFEDNQGAIAMSQNPSHYAKQAHSYQTPFHS